MVDYIYGWWYLIMVGKGITGGICYFIHRYVKANSKHMKDYGKNKESSYLKYWDVNNLYGWARSQKFSVNGFKWIWETPQFNEGFIESYNEESDEVYLLEFDVQYPEKLHEIHNDYRFY